MKPTAASRGTHCNSAATSRVWETAASCAQASKVEDHAVESHEINHSENTKKTLSAERDTEILWIKVNRKQCRVNTEVADTLCKNGNSF